MTAARPLRVLFLGHRSEHHNSAAYEPLLAFVLASRGIQLTYEDDPALALRSERLRHYDALLLYANHDSITPPEERALLDYVNGGGGFVAVHSASFCFRNSDAFVAMVGAQFKSHDTATFAAVTVQPEHPVMRGLQAFTTWDETYVHSHHNPDRTVLMERVQGNVHEPYTWVRTQGKGRVFYTAFGHDERTWGNPGFQQLLERGIEWVVPDSARAALAALAIPAPSYAEAHLPNYEKKTPAPRMQGALSPEESQKLIEVPAEFRVELFAAEPDIVKPIAMTWDERGRLWIAETLDYPNTIEPGAVGRDRIRILEDTDGDGRADKFTLFADSLNIPTSLALVNGGVIVSEAPAFLFLKDTTGDDRADVREPI
ncbi:MAG TPA: PVC-type heme-binding CxxCH protein, partial [Gemmatimonadaceae bacterium]|nr:PVC-type heme-binding CxxCH protein [Gemmatimonadaceae bacterium]